MDMLLMNAAPRKESFILPEDFGLMCTSVVRGACLVKIAATLEERAAELRTQHARAMLAEAKAKQEEDGVEG